MSEQVTAEYDVTARLYDLVLIGTFPPGATDRTIRDAAAEIERLRAEIATAEERGRQQAFAEIRALRQAAQNGDFS